MTRRLDLQDQGNDVLTRRRFVFGAALLAASVSAAPVRAGQPQLVAPTRISVERRGSEIRVEAQAEVDAAVGATWSTLADYDRLAEFIPDMSLSRTLERAGPTAVVEQQARATFGPFSQTFKLVLAVEEEPGQSIRAVALDGDFRRFDARYQLTVVDARRTRIDYEATLEPQAPVPPLVGLPVMRALIRRQFEAMLGEIGRRAATG